MLHFRSVKLVFAVLVCVSIVWPGMSNAQKGQTSAGTDFWLSFMPNYLLPADNIRIFIGSGTLNKVQVDVYGGSTSPAQHFTQTIQPDGVWTLSLPSTRMAEERLQEVPEYKGIHVYSQKPIAVYGLSNVYTTTDSYLAIPTPGLGTEYYPSCMYDDNYWQLSQAAYPEPLAGQFVIIAPYDNTNVTIGPARTDTRSDPAGTLSHAEGSTWIVSLMRGQTYLVQSSGLKVGDGDLTGTHIVSTKPIGLISGHQRCRIPVDGMGNSKNTIMEMIPPLDKWGTEYFDMPQGGRVLCGNYVRLIAGEEGVYITENGNGIAQLDHAGDFVDRELVLDPVVYKSNGKKFLVVEHSYSQNYNGDPINSDPFSIVMTPRNQFEKKMIFRVPNNVAAGQEFENYGTFICRKDSISRIMINGKRIGSYPFAGQGDFPSTNPQMSALRIKFPVATSTYVATCGEPFALYSYGFSYADGYGHPAGMALNVTSPDTLPPLQRDTSFCGNYQVKLIEPRLMPAFSFDDTRIADIAMITDSTDQRWSKASYNYTFMIDPAHPFTPGDSTAYFDLTLIDGSKNAYAAVWTTDRAGNDTVYEYYYTAPKLIETPKSPLAINSVWATTDSCRNIVLRNLADSDLIITSAYLDTVGTFKLSSIPSNVTLHPGDTLTLRICFTPPDTMAYSDTLRILVGCIQSQYTLLGTGVIPQIIADNLDFGNVLVGDTLCMPLTIRNPGKLPLVIDKNWLLNNPEFSFKDASRLPITILPGKSATLNFCFHPDSTGPMWGRQDWGTNLLDPFKHSIKDTSSLLGFGRQPGLEWDRPTQSFTVECDTQTIRMTLLNSSPPATGSVLNVSKVDVEGADSAEFTIVNTQKGTLPWGLFPGDTVWVDVRFKPDPAKGYAQRNARLVALSVGVADKTYQPIILLSGTVRHSTLRLTPTSYDFGNVGQNDPLSTTVWIHNDGDTDLVLSSVSVDGGYSITGFTPGQIVKPGDSAQVTVKGSAGSGVTNETVTATSAAWCTLPASIPIKASASNLVLKANGHDYGDIFVCNGDSAVIMIQNTGTQKAVLENIKIIDTLGTSGASQYSFTMGGHSQDLGVPLDTGTSLQFKVKFTPNADVSDSAWVVYSLSVLVPTPRDTTLMVLLTGTGLHYANTVTARKDAADTLYSAVVGNNVTIPIRLKKTFDPKALVYGFTYTLRYRRDVLDIQQVTATAGLTGSTNQPKPVLDVTDNAYEILTMQQTSTTPITTFDTVAQVQFRYMLNDSNTTPIAVHNVAFLDQAGNTVCWVTPDSIPGTFLGSDVCGDKTLRNTLDGILPSWIKSVTPNPTSGSTNIAYGINGGSLMVTIELYNLLGDKVSTILHNQPVTEGDHIATFDTAPLASGTYIVRLSTGRIVHSVRVLVGK